MYRFVFLAFVFVMGLMNTPTIATAAEPVSPVRLEGGMFRVVDDGRAERLYVPLGGLHGNVVPLELLELSDEQRLELKDKLWREHVDILDCPEDALEKWFAHLQANGVTCLRLFPRLRVGGDLLELCGKLNPEMQVEMARVFRLARPYGIRFLLQILPEPGRTGYRNRHAMAAMVQPRFSKHELQTLPAAQKRFVVDNKRVPMQQFFLDPDVWTCQQMFLRDALDWLASREPQVFALELYNEQGWQGGWVNGESKHVMTFDFEQPEIDWSHNVTAMIHQRMPGVPVTLSHAGFGLTAFDPLKWHGGAGTDFYSSHMYNGLIGAGPHADFAAATAATAAILRAKAVNFPGEWGILNDDPPADLRRLGHRDAIWLTLMAGGPGFLQWTFEFLDEYRWPQRVFSALPADFSPAQPELTVDITEAYRTFHDNTRYPLFTDTQAFDAFAFMRNKGGKLKDENLRKMYAAYTKSLRHQRPVQFVIDDHAEADFALDAYLTADLSAHAQPLASIQDGWEMSWLKDVDRPIYVAYFRSRTTRNIESVWLGEPTDRPLSVKLNLPDGNYRAYWSDVDPASTRVSSADVSADDVLPVSIDSEASNYMLLIVPAESDIAIPPLK
jgi:hypothetical protein